MITVRIIIGVDLFEKMQYALVGVILLAFMAEGFIGDRKVPEAFQGKRQPDQIDKLLTFRLFTRQKPHGGVTLTVGDKTKLLASGFKGSLPTVICCHGYFDSENTSWVVRTKQEVLKEAEVNVITLDYSSTAKNLLYNEVVNFTKEAGRYTGEFLKFLQKEGKFDVGKAHLIGHSLGAQLLGFAARAFPEKKTIGRISALDPAGPLFENAPETDRLNPNAAKVVDVIHTCTFFVGMKKPVGTIDFYPNGGFGQPGCGKIDLNCNHRRSQEYFYKTIDRKNSKRYTAKKCENLQNAFDGKCNGTTATMGYHLDYSSPGIYYLRIQ